tara:strand:+ start:2003 stop:2194 length:192 start_codon:yes stop_codon:yes gene_type:complete
MSKRKQEKISFEKLKKELIEKINSTDNEVLVCRCYEVMSGNIISEKSWDDKNRKDKNVIRLIT